MRRKLISRRRFARFLVLVAAILVSLSLITGHVNPFLIVRDLGYLTRPIWDTPIPGPEIVLPHFYAETVPLEEMCELHGWKVRNDDPEERPRVMDAVIFSIELDILEIRLRELWDVVDKFVVMEADRTFSGKSKPLTLHDNLERFKWAEDKLVVVSLRNTLKEFPISEFENENKMRREISRAIQSLQPRDGDLIIAGDVDEIPFPHTINLLRVCVGYPRELHLIMRNYVYSFEFYVDTTNWKPHITTYDASFWYHHGKGSATHSLADAGWHCSFCFRYLSDFIFKMTSYSHHDRVTGDHLLEKEEIQRKICEGANIFDMYPEAYTFKELFAAMGNVPKSFTTNGIPNTILKYKDKFQFLLPGGCRREDFEK